MSLYNCPLCLFKKPQLYYSDNIREYRQCSACDFVFVPSVFHLSETEEKQRYNLHNNNPSDNRYREFLSQVSKPLLERLPSKSKGLDFGCGPGPTLSVMLEEKAHKVDLFDKFFAKNNEVFDRKYDFITATEVLEHLSAPAFELNRLHNMLKKGGVMAIMTEMLTHSISFADWHYKNDPSHIGFFNRGCLELISKKWLADIVIISHRVVLITKRVI